MTRYNVPLNKLTVLQMKTDDMVSGLLYVSPEIDTQPSEVSLYINGELKDRNRPNFIYDDYMGMLRWLVKTLGEVSGYVSTGSIVGPVPLSKGQRVEVRSDKVSFEFLTL